MSRKCWCNYHKTGEMRVKICYSWWDAGVEICTPDRHFNYPDYPNETRGGMDGTNANGILFQRHNNILENSRLEGSYFLETASKMLLPRALLWDYGYVLPSKSSAMRLWICATLRKLYYGTMVLCGLQKPCKNPNYFCINFWRFYRQRSRKVNMW